ncbi:4'-phosphopantetheinyl transferase superfamily protein [Aureimonas sp. N4]|uniref:4'-phosphopantetheinyl transferase superfamily protein n=1 Tax=Aureimonas sp. N4 TaxID=1638165 RepID=UPI0009EC349D|nr:4'-phosphopantetheinyl transferase superfamily protein [Aureimonas sp. N4]
MDLMRLSKADVLYGDPRDWQGVFTPNECTAADRNKDPIRYLTSVWALREAVVKVLGGFQDGLAPTDLEICDALLNYPSLKATGGAAIELRRKGIDQILLAGLSNADLVFGIAIGLSAPTG